MMILDVVNTVTRIPVPHYHRIIRDRITKYNRLTSMETIAIYVLLTLLFKCAI